MIPSLTWLDFTADDRDRMRRVLDLFTEQGTIDELGLGTLRDALSDALFPGTSSIQTRLRYILFVPWIYQKLERDRAKAAEVHDRARRGARYWSLSKSAIDRSRPSPRAPRLTQLGSHWLPRAPRVTALRFVPWAGCPLSAILQTALVLNQLSGDGIRSPCSRRTILGPPPGQDSLDR